MTPTYLISEAATPDDFWIGLIHPVTDTNQRKPIKQAVRPGVTLMRYCRVAGTVLTVETRYESDAYHIVQLERTGRYGKDGWYVTFREVDDREYEKFERIIKRWFKNTIFVSPSIRIKQ